MDDGDDVQLGHPGRIRHLTRTTSGQLRSSLVIPTLPQVVSELAQNALDAHALRIEIWINVAPGNESIRVEDNGVGIDVEMLKLMGERNVTSKGDPGHIGPSGGYGFRGEAISSLAALSLLEITSRVALGTTYTKVIKNSHTLYQGRARSDIPGRHGTTITVRDLFNRIPVRQAALATISRASTLSACKRVVERLALVAPRVRWALLEDRPGGARSIFSLQGNSTTIQVYRSLYGSAGVESVQSVHVSSGNRRIDGFISLEGSITKSHQHLYLNRYPLTSSDLHDAITTRFAQSSFSGSASDLLDDIFVAGKQPATRKLERHPIFVLNLTLPVEEVDLLLGPRKDAVGYSESGHVKAFVTAVIDDFLRRHGFSSKKVGGQQRAGTVSPAHTPKKRSAPRSSSLSPMPKRRLVRQLSGAIDISSSNRLSPVAETSTAGSSKLGPQWINETIDKSSAQVFRRQGVWNEAAPSIATTLDSDDLRNPTFLTRILPDTKADITFPPTSVSTARVLRQVDRKFVACVLDAHPTATGVSQKALVVFDQHAADERAGVEKLLDALCAGFATDTMPTTELERGSVRVVLTRQEAEQLAIPGCREVLARWGIQLDPVHVDLENVEYVQVGVKGVPALLDRLGKKEPAELTRLLRLYLPVLEEGLGEIQALIASLGSPAPADNGSENGSPDHTAFLGTGTRTVYGPNTEHQGPTGPTAPLPHTASLSRQDTKPTSSETPCDDTPSNPADTPIPTPYARIHRWMPREMLHLANSKACRSATMFEDKLSADQCTRLMHQLGRTRNPWVCAHGRPTMVPLCVWDAGARGEVGVDMRSKDKYKGKHEIDWGRWKRRYWFSD